MTQCIKCHNECEESHLYDVAVNDETVKMCLACIHDWYESLPDSYYEMSDYSRTQYLINNFKR